MTTCKHCGAEIPENVGVCPNCGQQNTDNTDESYLDSLLNSVVTDTAKPDRGIPLSARRKAKQAERQEKQATEAKPEPPAAEEPVMLNDDELDAGLGNYSIFDEFSDDDAIDRMISEELDVPASVTEEKEISAESALPEELSFPLEETEEETAAEEEPDLDNPFLDDAVTEDFNADGALTEEPAPEELVLEEPDLGDLVLEDSVLEDLFSGVDAIEESAVEEPVETDSMEPSEADSVASIFEGFGFDESEAEEFQPESEEDISIGSHSVSPELIEGLDEHDMATLDNLFQEIEVAETARGAKEEDSLLHLLDEDAETSQDTAKGKRKKKKKKDSRTLLVKLFGNVPVDPSKVKHEPTPEEIAEKKQAKEEKKKKDAEEKKKAADEKKAAARAAKEEKAKLAQIAKEEKKAKKMEQAKLILEEMKDTRINRVGATIVFLLFALLAVGIFVGTNFITYNLAINNAKKSFGMARGNSPKYYNDAYDQIYGLESKLNEEDAEFYSKVMTVMFVNKQLNSYNSYVAIGDEVSALDSLLKGLKRYEKYSMYCILMGDDDLQYDLDYIRSQILAELDTHYGISTDEATALIKQQSSDEYAKTVYGIIDRLYGQGD